MSVSYKMESQRGRIGKEIKSGEDQGGKPWVNFSLAVDVDRRAESGEWERAGTRWFQVVAFGALAKNVAASLRPGAPVVVSGEVDQQNRIAQGDDGEPTVRTREQVRATMVAPDLILTPVVLPEARAPRAAGPAESPAHVAEEGWPLVTPPGAGSAGMR